MSRAECGLDDKPPSTNAEAARPSSNHGKEGISSMPTTRTRQQRGHRTGPAAPPSPPPVPTRADQLRPGHAVRIAGYGIIPVSREAGPVLAPLVAIRLGWTGLSLIVHPATPLDALTHAPAQVVRVWWCRHCDGTGQWQPEGRASNGGR
ncbi:hypothetical protein [Nonomuraea jabiensis]|uniref:hypothetical protein n=1 Tax=Nonomuraea jabiensis TaxID=882448 RepID=UPI00368522C9